MCPQITDFINGKLSVGEEPLPNYRKVRQLVVAVNEEKKLAMSENAVEIEAQGRELNGPRIRAIYPGFQPFRQL